MGFKFLGFEWMKKDSLRSKAIEANQVLNDLGLEAHTERGKTIRETLAMELLGQKYDLMDKHSKAHFVKLHSGEMVAVKDLIEGASAITRKKPVEGQK